ncbi:MAG TPA: FAD/NAD(P)-binding oxidoreductase [Kofleriaceae bacterium]|nr:FAD/NAD(P)-binding oxidoreductase [Kofleriaceae bacterium]
MTTQHHEILIVGGGTAGITVAALLRDRGAAGVAIVEPSDKHYYQPLWTLVGAGVMAKETTERAEADYIPAGVTWIRDAVAAFEPEANAIVTRGGTRITYDQLVVAVGIQLDWHKIKGLDGHLGKNGIVSNYRYDLVDSTWRELQAFEGGTALFTFPSTPVKCAGAPQKIMYLADDHLRSRGVRDRARILFASAGAKIFGVEHYAKTLRKVVERKGIETLFRHDLVEVRADQREAVFRHCDQGNEVVIPYNLLHVVPPQSAPDVVKKSALADAAGWVEVDKYSLQHARFPNVFSLGDASSLPTSRTGAAVRKQAPVLVENVMAFRAGTPLTARYDGYASCPLVTGYGKLVLAEFDYDGKPTESFPFDQSQERYSMYAMKTYALPEMYWNGMLRGRM